MSRYKEPSKGQSDPLGGMNEYLLASPQRLTYVAAVLGPTMLASIADDAQADQGPVKDALVAQLDRALDYESRGREFESSRARHFHLNARKIYHHITQ